MATEEITVRVEKSYVRFSLPQRIEHIVLLLSFSTLAVTGLIQKFADNPISDFIYNLLGGIQNVRIIHHVAAILLLAQCAYHVIVVLHKIYVRRRAMTMLPGLKDVTDALDLVRYNLGLTKEHPKMPRYNFAEKMEYWAMVWGTIVMAITGFMLWNPILTTNILPGEFIPAAKAAHGGEAILAVLAILVWHLYNVHIKMFNKSIFNGKMTRSQMKEEHGQELAQIDAGISRPLPSAEAQRRRERIFLPVALLLAAISGLAIFWFVTYETTAIATVPSQEVEVFVPLTPTPIASPTVDNSQLGAPIPHPIEGQEQCSTCHGPDGVAPYPTDHVDRPDESCQVCHAPGEVAAAAEGASIAAEIPHAVEGKEQCSTCHGDNSSLVPMPTDHIQPVADNTCLLCHKPAAGAAEVETASAKPIPHPIEGDTYKDCTVCHGPDKMKPSPENHAAFATDSCTMCHQQAGDAAEVETASAKPIPHPIEGAAYADCTVCHGPDKMKPNPENHAAFAPDSCTTCHQAPEAEEATATPAARETPAATPEATTAPAAGGPNPIPHPIEGAAYADCTVCHGPDKMKPNPENHAAFAPDSCTMCHQAPEAATPEVTTEATATRVGGGTPTATARVATATATRAGDRTPTATVRAATATPAGDRTPTATPGASAGGAKPIPHSIVEAAYQDCTVCHGPGKVKPNPPSHEAFPVSICAGCHPPQVEQ